MGGRRTRKLVEAIATAKANSIPVSSDRERLYTTLETRGFNWSSRLKTWSKTNPYTKSQFTTPTGEPTGHFKLRVQFHRAYAADETDNICQILNNNGYRITEVSDPYTNSRRDKDAVRVYISGEKKL